MRAEEMMHTKQFLVFKDRLIEYLRSFIKGLQRNVGVIEESLCMQKEEMKNQVFEKVVDYELSIPRMDVEVSKEMIWQKVKGRYQSIYDWFVGKEGQENEAGKLFAMPEYGRSPQNVCNGIWHGVPAAYCRRSGT